eukprot:2939121-Rhodomonas_salina.1
MSLLRFLPLFIWFATVKPQRPGCCQKAVDDHAALLHCCCDEAGKPLDAQENCGCGHWNELAFLVTADGICHIPGKSVVPTPCIVPGNSNCGIGSRFYPLSCVRPTGEQ